MIHIAFLSPEYSRSEKPEGGLANYLRKVGLALSKRGHHVSVFCLSNRNKHWQDDKGIQVYEVKRFTFPYQLRKIDVIAPFLPVIAQILSAKRLEKVFWKSHQTKPVDIIQASSYKSPGYTLLKNGKVPLVCRVSSYRPVIRASEEVKRTLDVHLTDWLEIKQVREAMDSFAPSQLMGDTYKHLESCKLRVIRTPLDNENYPVNSLLYDKNFSGKAYLLYFGTLKLVKGVDLFADIVTPLLENHPNLFFALIGRDDGLNSGERLFDFICRKNPDVVDRLIYSPAISKTHLYPIISNSLGVLMPSRVDNYPNACLEAHMLNVPVVGTYGSSLEEMIVDGKTGFLAKNDDPESFLFVTNRLLSLSSKQRALMKSNIENSIQDIKSEDRVGQLITFYQEDINKFHS